MPLSPDLKQKITGALDLLIFECTALSSKMANQQRNARQIAQAQNAPILGEVLTEQAAFEQMRTRALSTSITMPNSTALRRNI